MKKSTVNRRLQNSCLTAVEKEAVYEKMLEYTDECTELGNENNDVWCKTIHQVFIEHIGP